MSFKLAGPIIDSMGARKRLGVPRPYGHYRYGGFRYGIENQGLTPNPYGKIRMGFTDYGDYFLLSGVYQHTKTPWRHFYTRRPYTYPHDPGDPVVAANRLKFKYGMAAWKALELGVKAYYNLRALNRHMPGWSLFLKEYMSSH